MGSGISKSVGLRREKSWGNYTKMPNRKRAKRRTLSSVEHELQYVFEFPTLTITYIC